MHLSHRRPGLSVSRIFSWHCGVIAALTTAHLLSKLFSVTTGHHRLLGAAELFDLASETAAHTVVAVVAFLFASVISATIVAYERTAGRKTAIGWVLVTACLIFMMLDEGAMLHDRLAFSMQRMLRTSGMLFIGWVLPYLLLTAAVAIALIPFALRLPRATLLRLTGAATLFVASAIGVEMLEADLLYGMAAPGATLASVDLEAAGRLWLMIGYVAVEETGEMLAVALTIRALLLHLIVELDGDLPRISLEARNCRRSSVG